MGSVRMSLGLFDRFSGPKGATVDWTTRNDSDRAALVRARFVCASK